MRSTRLPIGGIEGHHARGSEYELIFFFFSFTPRILEPLPGHTPPPGSVCATGGAARPNPRVRALHLKAQVYTQSVNVVRNINYLPGAPPFAPPIGPKGGGRGRRRGVDAQWQLFSGPGLELYSLIVF